MSDLFSQDVLIALAVTCGAALATVLGALFVIRADHTNPRLITLGLAFSGGAMVYVSLVEIFGKSVTSFTEAYGATEGYRAATLAFFGGVVLLLLLDRLIPNPHADSTRTPDLDQKHIARVGLLAAAAITAHNFPEGAATFFATLDNPVIGAPLALAIAVHNIPEGISIAVPVFYATGSRKAATLAAAGSALAEPVGAVLAYLLLKPFLSAAVYGTVFGLIAGVMVFLALDELVPAAKRHAKGHDATYGVVAGMAVMALSLVLFK